MLKKILFAVCAIAALASCSTDESINEQAQSSELKNLYVSILSEDSINQFLILNSLDFNTQKIMWRFKIKDFITNQNLNAQQLEKMKLLDSFLETNDFTDFDKNKSLSDRTKAIKKDVFEVLSGDEQVLFFNSFENANQFLKRAKNVAPKSEPDYSISANPCTCSTMEGGNSNCKSYRVTEGGFFLEVTGDCVRSGCDRRGGIFGGSGNGTCSFI